jgi:flagellar biosynthesis protein FlhF
MRLKSFYANSMKEAMQLVKEQLGEEAVIISTKEEKGGVRLTAAIEEDLMVSHNLPEPMNLFGDPQQPQSGEWLHEDGHDNEDEAIVEHLTDALLRHGVPEDVTDHIISCASIMGASDAKTALTAALEHIYGYRPLPQKAYKKPIMLVGAPGAGKTLNTAKLAARGVMNGLKVVVITTDTIRAGGVEQLGAFTKILKIPLLQAATAQDLRVALLEAESKGAEQIFIDTAGMNPFDPQDMKLIAKMLTVANIDPLLVMPAGGDATESGEIARIFAALGTRWMMPSRLDIARRIGGILQAAHQGGLSFAEASHTAQVADGLMSMTPERLTELLIPSVKSK